MQKSSELRKSQLKLWDSSKRAENGLVQGLRHIDNWPNGLSVSGGFLQLFQLPGQESSNNIQRISWVIPVYWWPMLRNFNFYQFLQTQSVFHFSMLFHSSDSTKQLDTCRCWPLVCCLWPFTSIYLFIDLQMLNSNCSNRMQKEDHLNWCNKMNRKGSCSQVWRLEVKHWELFQVRTSMGLTACGKKQHKPRLNWHQESINQTSKQSIPVHTANLNNYTE